MAAIFFRLQCVKTLSQATSNNMYNSRCYRIFFVFVWLFLFFVGGETFNKCWSRIYESLMVPVPADMLITFRLSNDVIQNVRRDIENSSSTSIFKLGTTCNRWFYVSKYRFLKLTKQLFHWWRIVAEAIYFNVII